MKTDARIREAQEEVMSEFRRRPEAALGTKKLSGRLEEGLVFRAGSGASEVVIDMPKMFGGGESAPPPGHFVRAGLMGCLAVGIKLAAARENIEIRSIDIDVEMEFDDGALLAMGDNSAAPLATRLRVAVASPAPWDRVLALVDRALAADPYFLAFRDPQDISAEVVAKRD